MKEKILTFLKTKLTGVQENYLSGVAEFYAKTITEEKEIETTLTDGVIDLLKANAAFLQSEGDKRANEAADTAIKNYRKKYGLDENGQPAKKEPDKKDDKTNPDEPAWFREYREKRDAELTELRDKMESQEKERSLKSLVEKVRKHDKLKDIDDDWFFGHNLVPESEDGIPKLVDEIRSHYDAFVQKQAEKGVIISTPLKSGGAEKEGTAIGRRIAREMKSDATTGIVGKKI